MEEHGGIVSMQEIGNLEHSQANTNKELCVLWEISFGMLLIEIEILTKAHQVTMQRELIDMCWVLLVHQVLNLYVPTSSLSYI